MFYEDDRTTKVLIGVILFLFLVLVVLFFGTVAQAAPYSPQAGFHPRSGQITIDAGLQQGADGWNAVARRPLFVVSDHPQVTVHQAGFEGCYTACATGITAEGVACEVPYNIPNEACRSPYVRGEVYLTYGLSKRIVAHELGHILGLDHSPRRGIMSPRLRFSRRYDHALLEGLGYV